MLARQKALFEEWKVGRENFVTDGIVDEDEYRRASKKLLFLLKEVNGGKNWDLCDFLRNGGRAQTWDNIARWVEGIFNLDKDIAWAELTADKKINEQRRFDMLKKICVVNVKKAPGVDVSVNKEIKNTGEQDAEYLKRQINIYEPEIIICCGSVVSDVYTKKIAEKKAPWMITSRGVAYMREGNRVVIDYVHPEARVPKNIVYYGLIDALREIL